MKYREWVLSGICVVSLFLCADALATDHETPIQNTAPENKEATTVVFPATEATQDVLSPIEDFLVAKREPRDPAEEDADDEIDVQTPLGQVREIARSLREQRRILDRLDRREQETPNDRTDEVLTALRDVEAKQPTPETIASLFPRFDDEIQPLVDEAIRRLQTERETLESNMTEKLNEAQKTIRSERESMEATIDGAVETLQENAGIFDPARFKRIERCVLIVTIMAFVNLLFVGGALIRWIVAIFYRIVDDVRAAKQIVDNTPSKQNSIF